MAIVIGPKLPVMVSGASGDTYLTQGNALLRMIQALVQCNVKNITTSAPPGGPANGDTYAVAAGGSGAWTGHDKAIAYWSTDNPSVPLGEWEFFAPKKGWLLGNQADGLAYIFDGTNWVAA